MHLSWQSSSPFAICTGFCCTRICHSTCVTLLGVFLQTPDASYQRVDSWTRMISSTQNGYGPDWLGSQTGGGVQTGLPFPRPRFIFTIHVLDRGLGKHRSFRVFSNKHFSRFGTNQDSPGLLPYRSLSLLHPCFAIFLRGNAGWISRRLTQRHIF